MAKEKDTITKKFMSKQDVFADAVNYCIYDGRAVVKPEDLRELDPEELLVLPEGEGKTASVQKYRDILKGCIIRRTEDAAYVMIGIENQSEVHYGMPVRNMVYDALNYGRQVERLTKKNRRNRRLRTDAEYLSGLRKDDKLVPVITLTVCFYPEVWEGPRSLYEMFGTQDADILKCVSDYRLNLIAASEIEDFTKFSGRLGKVMEFIAVSKDKEKLLELLEREQGFFSEMDTESVQLLNTCVNAKIEIKKEKEEIDMCKAIDDLIQDGRMEGETIGEARGRAEGETIGEARGRANGRMEMVQMMYHNGMSMEDISHYTEISLELIKNMVAESAFCSL